MSRQDRWLLPEGIEEILPKEARRFEAVRRRLLDLLDTWGYDLVMPPMIEYIESLLTGVGKDLDLQTFKLTDQLTGRLMGVRADITPQAARIDAHYLKRETPVRLCYLGSVLRTRPDAFAGPREPLQLGAELFGHAGAESDIEVLRLMVETLRCAGVQDVYLDLGHVGVFRSLAQDAGLSKDQEGELFDVLQRKARPEVDRLLANWDVTAAHKTMLARLIDLRGDRAIIAHARTALTKAGAATHEALARLEQVANLAQRELTGQTLHFDLAELHGYRYYTGTVFSAFVPGYGQAVAQGGRYDDIGRAFGRARPAVGFSADLRAIVHLVNHEPPARRGILAPAGGDTLLSAKIGALRSDGERVLVRLPGDNATVQTMDCDREIIKVDDGWVVVQRQS